MPLLADQVFDNGLSNLVSNGSRLDICSAEPTSYAEATSTYSLGNKTSISIGSPGDRAGGGRKVTVAAISGGSVTADGTAGYWAITDGASTLLAAGPLGSSQGVTNGNNFSLGAFDIGFPDPA